MMMEPRIYDRNMALVGVLQNASSIGYKRTHNDLFTASFELPYDDPKTSLCGTHYIVDVFDGEVSKGKYRILDEPDMDVSSEGQFVKYSCEHVIAFLLNDVIDGYLEIGCTGVTTRQVIENILGRQTVQRWQLGQCDFNYQFQYSWENTNLLDALFSIPTCFSDDYHWTYNTDTYPWTINLLSQSTDRKCEIRRKRNMQQIQRAKDSSALCTRLYCKGSGEGVNQLTIKEVNEGLPYIDADTISTYGVLCAHYIDLTVTDAATLLAKGRAVLEEVKHPRYTYTAKAADLSKITGLAWDAYDEGEYVHVIDEEKGIDVDAMIVEVSKADVDGDPLNIDMTISNKSSDVSSTIEDLSKRAAITAQYSQGATNLYAQQYADNADSSHPAAMKVYVPNGCSKINQMLLSWRLSAFRAYETGASAGGGTTATSSSGGGSESTSRAGGSTTITEAQRVVTTEATTGGTMSGHSGDTSGNTGGARDGNGNSVLATGSSDVLTTGGNSSNTGYAYYAGSIKNDTGSAGAHTHTGPSHTHGMGHFHYGAAHVHNIAGHSHNGPSHTHTGPSHTHSFSGSSSTSGGVSTNATHSVKITALNKAVIVANGHTHAVTAKGSNGYAGTGSTGSAGSGNTSSVALTTDSAGDGMTGNAITSGGNSRIYTTESGTGETSSAGAHTHSMQHTHPNDHTHTVPAHTHSMAHIHNFSHSHNVVAVITIPAITISIPSHRHTVTIDAHTHSVTIAAHTHEIIYGIYEGGTASSVTIKIDDTIVPASAVSSDEMDIVAYLSKDSNGKITRGTWHTVEIVPNSLTRIEANLFVQTFVTSYSGGNY